MAKAKTTHPTIITPTLVLSMATLMMVMAGVLVSVSNTKTPTQVETKAATPVQETLLSESDDVDSLEEDLIYLEVDPVSEEMQVFENLE